MKSTATYIDAEVVHRLLSSKNSDAAMLYLYINSGNNANNALYELGFTNQQFSRAVACLQTLGLQTATTLPRPTQKPAYSHTDVLTAMNEDNAFPALVDEIQRRLGRMMNTEELKIILNMTNYLGLSAEVICLLISYCSTNLRRQNATKPVSLFLVEKEAYRWADMGIETPEQALSYIQQKNEQRSHIYRLAQILQIHGRKLTPPEEAMAQQWLQMGFSEEMLQLAYEKTCLATGGMNWAYMNAILNRWKEANYHTAQDVKRRQSSRYGSQSQRREPDPDIQAAIQRLLQEDYSTI